MELKLELPLRRRKYINKRLVEKFIKNSLIKDTRIINIIENGKRKVISVTREGIGTIETKNGTFWLFNFKLDDKWNNYEVLVKSETLINFVPKFVEQKSILLRIDSGCETGQVYGDITCECDKQLQSTIKLINMEGEGIIIHIPSQEGRGLGLNFKLATLLAERYLSLDTVAAAKLLVNDKMIDNRTYMGAVAILRYFRINNQLRVITNNPTKLDIFTENKYVIKRIPMVIKPDKYTYKHLNAKQKYLGHIGLIHR